MTHEKGLLVTFYRNLKRAANTVRGSVWGTLFSVQLINCVS